MSLPAAVTDCCTNALANQPVARSLNPEEEEVEVEVKVEVKVEEEIASKTNTSRPGRITCNDTTRSGLIPRIQWSEESFIHNKSHSLYYFTPLFHSTTSQRLAFSLDS